MDGVNPNARIKSIKRYANTKMLVSTVPVIKFNKWYVTTGKNGNIFKKVNNSQPLYNEKKKGKTNIQPDVSL